MTLSAGTVLTDLARSVRSVAYGDLTDSLVETTTSRILHATGVAVVGTQFEPFAVALRALDPGSGDTPVLARGGAFAAGDAAFANAVAAHSSLQEDCGPGGFEEGSHPGTYIVPAALAAAHHTHASGERLLRGVIAGYEAVGIIGRLAPRGLGARRFRPVGIMGAFGAAAAVSTILSDDLDVLARAIAIASNTASGSSQGFVSGTSEPFLHAGFGARNGYFSASLAAAGATASDDALDGDFGFFAVYAGEPARVLDAATDSPAAITRLGSKKFAVCLQNQESLELARELRSRVPDAEIQRISLRRPQTPANGTASPGVAASGPYDTMLQRQMSARYSVAAALLGRPVDDPRYFANPVPDDEVLGLAGKVDLEVSEDDEVQIALTLSGGESASLTGRRAEILFPDAATIRSRFLVRVASVLGDDSASRVLDIASRLRDVRDAAVLTGALAGA